VTRRVVVTGIGGVTPLGEDWPAIRGALREGRTGVRVMESWSRFHGINTRLACPALNFTGADNYPRKKVRTMGAVARMATWATERALTTAGLLDDPVLRSGRTGIAYGSSFGSPQPYVAFAELITQGASRKLNATSYIQMMSHTAAVNIGLFFGVTGRTIPTSSACTSGSQAIGYAAEAIRWGRADVMLAGGADELDIGEGAATLILEEYEHARARGAPILAEVAGFGTNTDGSHATQPQAETMAEALRLALRDAAVPPEAIGCVNGHGTATEWGDIAETVATASVLGSRVPIHALKSYFGHTLGACGAIEAWVGIEMMREGWIAPTANLRHVDTRCAALDYAMGEPRRLETEYFMSNNFAFGGINTSLVFRRM